MPLPTVRLEVPILQGPGFFNHPVRIVGCWLKATRRSSSGTSVIFDQQEACRGLTGGSGKKIGIKYEGESHDVVDNKGPIFLSHDVIDNTGTYRRYPAMLMMGKGLCNVKCQYDAPFCRFRTATDGLRERANKRESARLGPVLRLAARSWPLRDMDEKKDYLPKAKRFFRINR